MSGLNLHVVRLTGRDSRVVFDNALVVEHDAAVTTSVEKSPHQFHLPTNKRQKIHVHNPA